MIVAAEIKQQELKPGSIDYKLLTEKIEGTKRAEAIVDTTLQSLLSSTQTCGCHHYQLLFDR